MKTLLLLNLASLFFVSWVFAEPAAPDVKYYRQLTLALRQQAQFKVSQINQDQFYSYSISLGDPIYAEPVVHDLPLMNQPEKFFRTFWDRIALKDGSKVILNGEEVPLTCIFVSGQDNRFAGKLDALYPEFVMRVYLVANDFSCVGPINPGWPNNGGKKETWDTYVYYEIKDPTIMLPIEGKLRYRWNEFRSVLVR